MSDTNVDTSNVEKSVVQIFADHAAPSYSRPWSSFDEDKSGGTGFGIKLLDFPTKKSKLKPKNQNKYILTNAHCVHNAIRISIRKRGISIMYRAKIEAIIYECDLALLSIDDHYYSELKKVENIPEMINKFWDDIDTLTIGGLPNKLDRVYVYGYPLGGYNISVTTGSVNRIQVIRYFDAVMGIAIQIDAPINFGNSGGPVTDAKGVVIGVAFSGEDDKYTQNMGYIIPTTLVRYFFNAIKSKHKFMGLCNLDVHHQQLYNQTIRNYLGVPDNITGVMVTYINQTGISMNKLKSEDIITKIDGKYVDNDGTMNLKDVLESNDPLINTGSFKLLDGGEIVLFTNFIGLKKYDEIVNITVFREGKSMDISIVLGPKKYLIPILDYQIHPSYYVLLGIIFIPLSVMLYTEKLNDRKEEDEVDHLLHYLDNNDPTNPDEQILVASQITPTEYVDDFTDVNLVLKSVNNVLINNLKQLYDTVKTSTSKFLKLEFKNTTQVIIISASDITKHQSKLLDELGIPSEYEAS